MGQITYAIASRLQGTLPSDIKKNPWKQVIVVEVVSSEFKESSSFIPNKKSSVKRRKLRKKI